MRDYLPCDTVRLSLAWSYVAFGAGAAGTALIAAVATASAEGALPLLPDRLEGLVRQVSALWMLATVVTGAFLAMVSFLVSYGLFRGTRWARLGGLLGATSILPCVPVGTAIALLTYWCFLVPGAETVGEVRASTAADAFR